MTYNAADAAQIDRRKDRAKRDELVEKNVITALMSHPEGRRYIWKQLEDANVFAQTIRFAPGGYAMTAFEEGKRSGGIKLHAAVSRYAPKEYVTMTQENTGVQLESEDERSTDTST